jgi:hypothetical protein
MCEQFEVSVRGHILLVELCVSSVVWGDCGIGHYQYGDRDEYDSRPFIEEFDGDIFVYSDRRKEFVKPSPGLENDIVDRILEDEYIMNIMERTFKEREE